MKASTHAFDDRIRSPVPKSTRCVNQFQEHNEACRFAYYLIIDVLPISSMYGIFTYIYHKNQPNVGKYAIHGWYGLI